MTCWQCGAALPPDVGFCRACSAFVRPRNAPLTRPAETTTSPEAPGSPTPTDLGAAPPPLAGSAWHEMPPRAGAQQMAWSPAVPRTALTESPPNGSRSPATAAPATWPVGPTARSGFGSGTSGPSSSVGDVVALAGTGFVLISMFLTWYSVTVTALGVQFYESVERALFARLFPQAGAGLGGFTGPITYSVSALAKEAGGWRWAILVVSIVLLLEIVLAIGSGVAKQASPMWPHGAILLALSVTNLILVGAAFFSLPYGGTPAAYLSVSHGIGAYVALVAALLACGGAVARIFTGSPGSSTSR
jgi:hypothetical protein